MLYKIFVWGIIAIGGGTVLFALFAILSLIFDGFSDRIVRFFKGKDKE